MSGHDPCQAVYDALDQHDCAPRGPAHRFTAKCPAHADRTPSLTIAEGADRRAVLHCFAGCQPEAVVRALGLTWSDLFADGSRHAPASRRPKLISEPAINSVQRVLDAIGIGYRGTALANMIVASKCPSCRAPDLWIHDDGHHLRASCWTHGCRSELILTALRKAVEREVDHAPA